MKKNSGPPRLATRILRGLLRSDIAEDVLGDLEEQYTRRAAKAPLKARLIYWYQTINYLRPFAVRLPSNHFINKAMFAVYFRMGWRQLLENKTFSIINITGLTAGMATAILIGLWVHDELSYDSYHANRSRIAQVYKGRMVDGKLYCNGQKWLPFPLLAELQTSYGEHFEYLVPAEPQYHHILSGGDVSFRVIGQYIGENALRMLTPRMLEGDLNALANPSSIVLSASTAKMLFGDELAVGKALRVDDRLDVIVSGVFEDLPANSSFQDITFFLPWERYLQARPDTQEQGWDNHFVFMYGLIRDGESIEQASTAIADSEYNVIAGIDAMKEEYADHPQNFLLAMKDWRLRSTFRDGQTNSAPVRFVQIVAATGAFVLLLACINFINLGTARAETRLREIGVRKSIGSDRSQLFAQFMTESLVVVMIAFVLALAMAWITMPWFNDVVAKQLAIPFTSLTFWLTATLFLGLTTFMAGAYPSIFLSSFNPVLALKGRYKAATGALISRRLLVIFQFAVSLFLVTASVVTYQQIEFAKSRPAGYEKQRLLLVPMQTKALRGKHELLRAELLQTGYVAEVAESEGPITDYWSNDGGFSWRGAPLDSDVGFATLAITHAYGRTVQWRIVEGEDFDGTPSDSSFLVINRAAAKLFGSVNPIGEQVHWKSKWHFMDNDFIIKGVIDDLIMRSPYEPIKPEVFYIGPSHMVNIRLKPDVDQGDALVSIQKVFKKLSPVEPFEYGFVDDEYEMKFSQESKIGTLARASSMLAILISCLGLTGLALFMTLQRTKEIGIRKAVGASVFSLWGLLSREFILLALFSSVIAGTTSYMLFSSWLDSFSYHTEMSMVTILLASLGSIAVTIATVSFQSLRAARMNPVLALRTE